jgi:hypothetical protein
MRNAAIYVFTILIFTATPARAIRISDVEIPDMLTPVNSAVTLQLNGAGIREKLFMDIYIGALYLPEKSASAAAILSSPEPASVLMHFLYKTVSKEKITAGWTEGLEANHSPAEMQLLQPKLEQFNQLFLTVHAGDVIRIDYLPGNGTEVRINNEWRGKVAGDAFFPALLKVWLGEHPVSISLKNAMLGVVH